MCKLCETRGKTWKGDDPICAFDEHGNLKKDNWNCATLSAIRKYAYSRDYDEFYRDGLRISYHCCSNDEDGLMISYDGMFVFMQWYKSRGRVEHISIHNKGIKNDEEAMVYLLEIIKRITKKGTSC